jgi:hypothetical protein
MELRPPNYKILENLIEPNSQKTASRRINDDR